MAKGALKILKMMTRLVLGLVLLTLGLAIILPVAAYFLFDPNDYRPQIAEFISQKTGLPLAINGQIDFQLFPWFGLKVQQLDLLPQSEKVHFIQVQEVGFQIPLKELMRSHFQIEALMIKGMQVNLIKQANGKANWEYLSEKINKTSGEESNVKHQSTPKEHSTKKLHFNITNFNVENATIYYHDQQENQLIVLDKLYLQGKSEKELIYPIKGKFELIMQQAQEKKPLLKGNGDFNGKALLASKTLIANLQTHFSGQTSALNQQSLQLSSHVEINPSTAINFKDLALTLGQTKMTGKAKVPVDSHAPITFNLHINQLNFDQMQLTQNESTSAAVAHRDSGFKQVKAQKKLAPVKKSATRLLSGDIQVNKIIAKNVTLTQVKSHVKKAGSLLKLEDLQASLYQGTLQGSLSKDLANPQSSVYFQGKVNNVLIEPLLKDLKKLDKLTGVAGVNFNMSYQPRHGFNGKTQFQIQHGTLKGIDVNYYLATAQSFLKKEPVTAADTKLTPFDNLTGTLNFFENVVHNPDLQFNSADFKGNGEGSINLNTQAIAYKLQAIRQYHDNKEHPNAYPLALRVRGTLEHPIVEPDLDLYLKEALKREATKQINKQLDKQLGKILGVDKAKENNPENASDDDASTKDKLQEKIEKEVGKGLKKILGM